MGTNYYIMLKEPEIVTSYDYHAQHIAKTSCGWRTCFEDSEKIHSVADIKAMIDSGEWTIEDEYGDACSWEEFIEDVVNHEPDGKSHIAHAARHSYHGFAFHVDEHGNEFAEYEFS